MKIRNGLEEVWPILRGDKMTDHVEVMQDQWSAIMP